MKGKNIFSPTEITKLSKLIKTRIAASHSEQKVIRAKMRKIGFYGSDFGIHDLQPSDFQNLINSSQIKISQHENVSKILLNDLLGLEDLKNVKIRFNLMFDGVWNPVEFFQNQDHDALLRGQYWNYGHQKSFKEGQITLGFIRLNEADKWLLFHIGKITKDLDVKNGIGYQFETLSQYEKFFGRLIIKFKNRSQTMIRLATSVMDQCEVHQLLPDTFDNDIFPGYEKVDISWSTLARVIKKTPWITALENQKGVYLITDRSNGKKYVGSAYGNSMILGRWKSYVKNGHGGNKQLKKLSFDYIKANFHFSILDIYRSTTDDQIILDRESWWKGVLQTREFGYNEN